MSDNFEQLKVTIQTREFQFKCPVERKEELMSAVEHLNGMIDEFRNNHRFSSLEHVVVLIAINLICEKAIVDERLSELLTYVKKSCNNFSAQLMQLSVDLDVALVEARGSDEEL